MKDYYYLFLVLIFNSLNYIVKGQSVESPYATYQAIKEEDRAINVLDTSKANNLPVGIISNVGGQEVVIGIENFVINPQGSYISASAVVDVPFSEEKLTFSGENLKVTPSGILADGGKGRIALTQDQPLILNNKVKLTLKASERKTFLDFSCEGFIGMGIQGEFAFCRNLLIPELPDGTPAPEPALATANFETYLSDWGSLLAKVSFKPFQIPALKGFSFNVQDAWLDYSDLANPTNIVFPTNYQSTSFDNTTDTYWQGFFLKSASIKLPKQFNTNPQALRKEIFASNLIIDNMGLSGWFGAKNLINFEEGALSNWPFSLDSIGVGFTCNKITGAAFQGKINIPIAKENTVLNYTAIIEEGDKYYFNVRSSKTIEVPLWSATMSLYNTSSIDIIYANNQFIPKATLNGDINLKPGLQSGDVSEFKGIKFENLLITSQSPYVIPGTFGIESTRNNELAGFNVTLRNVGIVRRENLIGLQIGLEVHLMKDTDGGFSAGSGITVFGKMESPPGGGRAKWKYDHVSLDEVSLAIDQGSFKMRGVLMLYKKDPIYGSGFKGTVDLEVAKLTVSATAQFGKKNNFNYWYADALVRINQGVTIVPGLAAYGFGGGLYYHMKLAKFAKAKIAPNAGAVASTVSDPNALASITPPPSGNAYVPDSTLLIGFKATVIVGAQPTSKAFNADATFEIAFNDKLGISYINIAGNGYFMTDMDDRSPNAPVRASVDLAFDFPRETVHGNFKLFVNIPGTLVGMKGNNEAGDVELHFEPSTWYIHAGTPDNRNSLRALNMLTLSSYLMIGKQLPGMPTPPANVSKILGGKDLNFMRNENTIGKGGGFAFGASIDFNTGKQQFLIFYGQFQAGIGFDIMLKDYGPDVQCEGRSSALGVNGWYAAGQAYAYMQGEIGIKVDLLFVSGEFKILELGAAAVLQAKLPNPTYLEGNVGGYYSILGGKIKGNCDFKLTIGEQCKFVGGSALSGIKVISGSTPSQNESNVNVFNNPQATFSLPLEKVFELEDLDGSIKAFKIKLRHFKLHQGSREIVGTLNWNEAMDVVAFNSSDILPRKTSIKMSVKVYFEELKNNFWQEVVVNGKAVEELLEYSFNTGEAPTTIPASNVKYSYPIKGQYNFYKSEYGQAYVQLVKGQDDLFNNSNWKHLVRFKNEDKAVEAPLLYDNNGNTITCNVPTNLANDKVFSMEFVSVPVTKVKSVDQNIKTIAADTTQMVSVETKEIKGNLDVLEDNVIYNLNFRTSKFSTFNEKMSGLSLSGGWRLPILQFQGLHELGIDAVGNELFDKFEIASENISSGLIRFEASLNNKWFKDSINPMLYKEYPISGSANVTWRDVNILGLPPVKAINIRQNPDNTIISDSQIGGGGSPSLHQNAAIVYNLPFYMYKDYLELQQKVARLSNNSNAKSNAVNLLLTKGFPMIIPGQYGIEAKYTLPGLEKVTSTYKFSINNH